MNKLQAFIFSILVFTAQSIFAAKIELYVWNPGETLAPMIIPVRDSEKPESAAKRYLYELSKNTDLMELFEGRLPHLSFSGFTALKEDTTSNFDKNTLLIANLPKDYTKNTLRVENFTKIFNEAHQKTFILPINANLGLSRNETKDFFQQLHQNFSMLVAMGGEDVDPTLYKQDNFHSRNTVTARDQFEIQLIKSYTEAQKGFLLGVCRGSQISAVALGYSLIQDLPFQKGETVHHSETWHDIQFKPTTHKILTSLVGGKKIHVNSLHHQAVVYKPGGPLEIAATSIDGVTEATEFKNGHGLLLQFHPELMNNELGKNILYHVVRQKNKVSTPSCRHVLR